MACSKVSAFPLTLFVFADLVIIRKFIYLYLALSLQAFEGGAVMTFSGGCVVDDHADGLAQIRHRMFVYNFQLPGMLDRRKLPVLGQNDREHFELPSCTCESETFIPVCSCGC